MSDSTSTKQEGGGRAPAKSTRARKMPSIDQLRGRQLGRVLIKMGKLRRAQVHEALDIQKERRGPIGAILVELGHITEEDLNLALAAQIGMEPIALGKMDVPPEVLAVMTSLMANTYRVVPYDLDTERNLLSLALDNPDNFVATDDLKTLLDYDINLVGVIRDGDVHVIFDALAIAENDLIVYVSVERHDWQDIRSLLAQ